MAQIIQDTGSTTTSEAEKWYPASAGDTGSTGVSEIVGRHPSFLFFFGPDAKDIFLEIEKVLQEVTLYARYVRRIRSFAYLRSDWNPYDAAPPNSEAIDNALQTLAIMRESGILPDLINPSVEEGIAFEWKIDDRFFLFEFYNDGEIIYLKGEGDEESHVFEVDLEEVPLIIREVANA